jgi:nitrogen fixation NifU-like protein
VSLDGLYREIILDHYQNPRNRGVLEDADAASHGHNPLCGDEVDVFLKLRGSQIDAIGFTSRGCSISQATASMMTESVKGHTVEDAEAMVAAFKAMMLEGGTLDGRPEMADLEALQGVKQYPVRIKCALLPWNTLQDALDTYQARSGSA